MIIRSYRIVSKRYVLSAFDGEGARDHGGRWNCRGTRMVYTAGSSSAAILDLLVHSEDYSILKELYAYIPVDIDEKLINIQTPDDSPSGWNRAEIISATQRIGDEWIDSASSVVLRVPSAVAPEEYNYLVNPAHPDFEKLKIGEPQILPIDSRL